MDISLIPTQELIDDKEASLNDIVACETALAIGIETYSGGSVRDRLECNRKIVVAIDAELERRAQDDIAA
jgi:hypothetical protein